MSQCPLDAVAALLEPTCLLYYKVAGGFEWQRGCSGRGAAGRHKEVPSTLPYQLPLSGSAAHPERTPPRLDPQSLIAAPARLPRFHWEDACEMADEVRCTEKPIVLLALLVGPSHRTGGVPILRDYYFVTPAQQPSRAMEAAEGPFSRMHSTPPRLSSVHASTNKYVLQSGRTFVETVWVHSNAGLPYRARCTEARGCGFGRNRCVPIHILSVMASTLLIQPSGLTLFKSFSSPACHEGSWLQPSRSQPIVH